MDFLRPTVFFRPETISKVKYEKKKKHGKKNTKSATVVFSSPRSIVILLSFAFATVILELMAELRN